MLVCERSLCCNLTVTISNCHLQNKMKISCLNSNMRLRTFPLNSYYASVYRNKAICSELISLQRILKGSDFNSCVLM